MLSTTNIYISSAICAQNPLEVMMFDFDDLPEEEFAPALASAVETNGEHPKNSSDDGEDVVAEPYSAAGEDVGAAPPSEAEPK